MIPWLAGGTKGTFLKWSILAVQLAAGRVTRMKMNLLMYCFTGFQKTPLSKLLGPEQFLEMAGNLHHIPGYAASIFVESDYAKETRDTNQTRQREKSGGLTRKLLKKGAIPSQFPNLPKYFSHAKPQQRSNAALGESRLAKEMESLQVATDAFLSADKIQSLAWLQDQLEKETLPSGTNVKMQSSGDCLNIYGLSHAENDCLVISYSIQISSTLHYCLFLYGSSVHCADSTWERFTISVFGSSWRLRSLSELAA